MTSKEQRGISQDLGGIEEDEEDLFEIDLEAVNCISQHYNTYWESNYFTSSRDALLANCLLPISHISSAIPACNAMSFLGNSNVFLFTEPKSLGEYLRVPFLGDFGLIDEKMKAKFHFQFQT